MKWIVAIAGASLLLWLLSPIYARYTAARMNAVSLDAGALTLAPTDQLPVMVADLHADPLLWNRDWDGAGFGHIDLPRLHKGNVGIQVFGLVTGSPKGQNFSANEDKNDRVTALVIAQHWPPRTWFNRLERARYQMHSLDQRSRKRDDLILIRSQADLEQVISQRQSGKSVVGALLGLEGAHALGDDLANFKVLQQDGLRMLGLAHFFDNAFAGSAHGIAQYGLTDKGRALLEQAQTAGVIIDLAHASTATFNQTIGLSQVPVVVSHSGVKATCDSPRNLREPLIKS